MFDLEGKTLGKYRLLEKLGQGGMAQVYKAYHPELDRYVALKVLHPHLTTDDDFTARFRREARAIAALEHPHIIRVYDFDEEAGLAFLVMEYLAGISLKEQLHRLHGQAERLALAEVGRIVGALADALEHAHRQGIVHRDLKPSNVIITANGRPVLTDFGIARMVDATTVTESGGTLGTPAYMSPEQGRGEPGDARSDIYALGVLLYQLCTGQLPFDADTPYAIILKHITAPLPPPRSLRPDLPEAVERVILKALAKDPDDRFQSGGDLGRALHAALATDSIAPPTDRVRNRPRRPVPVRGLALIALIGVMSMIVFLIVRSQPPTTPPPLTDQPAMLTLEGPTVTQDTWLDPDTPDEHWHAADLVHLQGPLTSDRLLLRFDLASLPAAARIVSATLTLRADLWGEQSFPGAAVIYRVLSPWEATTASYGTPWQSPGMLSGVDYDPTPLDIVPVPDRGVTVFDVSRAVAAWQVEGKPNYGLVVMMSADTHNQFHHWAYLSEQPDPADRPTLRVWYEAAP